MARGALKVIYSRAAGAFDKAFAAVAQRIENASTAAMRDTGDEIKAAGRQNIRAGGMSARWANAFRVNLYPRRGTARNPAVFAFHRIPYAGVFERGATIQGQPLLWIPLPNVVKKVGGKRLTPARFVQAFGPLFRVTGRGGKPLLMARVGGRQGSRITAAKLRKGGPNAVPIFVGQSTVRVRKRFGLYRIFDAAARRIAERYARHLG
jgi:hypothetical protein